MHSVDDWLILSACHDGLRGDQQQSQGALVKRLGFWYDHHGKLHALQGVEYK